LFGFTWRANVSTNPATIRYTGRGHNPPAPVSFALGSFMTLFRKPSIEESKSKAFLVYFDLRNLHINGKNRVAGRFPGIPENVGKEWPKEFAEIGAEISRVGHCLTKDEFVHHITTRFPFLNKKAVKQCQAIIQYNTDRGLW
jgi:hypothetical protein